MRRLGRAGLEFARRSRVSRNRGGGSQRSGLGRAGRSDVALPLSAECAQAGESALGTGESCLIMRIRATATRLRTGGTRFCASRTTGSLSLRTFTATACRKSGKRERVRRQSPSLSRIQTNVRVATTRGGAALPDDLDRKPGSDQSPLGLLLWHKKERRD